ncbi:hypothetical protein QAD02_022605 [Eretmocerus hayati]|uniref:Uncharacterized protein n=1 Tax=Eretmocerus hayati TaxID=131215 RepID=A0ACC2PTG7_9HYME|nr:hypothetical protein QAD02_022605 [Eretmocerus hayati]
MARVPKHRRIKRATVLIKRTRCVKNIKSKTYTPLYQKLKHNNHSLAKALTQEKQESQSLFTRNIELLSEVQDLVQACNSRDLVIGNVLKNSKQMMQMLVTMSEFLSNTISSCQEYVSNQQISRRTSSSSAGRRESTKRMSTKSPARGVVKPMVSGHTITRPTINLSRVNMQRLQNVNLSIIEEGPSSPDRSLNRSVESRRSRVLPERISVPALGTEDAQDCIVLNRRANRFSGSRLSGRFSKRNSGRLSSRLSKRSSEHAEVIKSPRVALQDVSRYLCNSQTVNVRTLSESARSSHPSRSPSNVEEEQVDDVQSNAENSNAVTANGTDAFMESDSDAEDTLISDTSRSQTMSNETRAYENRPLSSSSDTVDPMEGPSWLYDSTMESPGRIETNRSPVSSILSGERRKSTYFRIPELPKNTKNTRFNLNNARAVTPTMETPSRNTTVLSSSFVAGTDEDSDDQRVNLRYITQRRGPSSRTPSVNDPSSVLAEDDEDEDDDDEETLILNMKRQLKPQPLPRETEFEQPERLQFDMNELLQLTPLKPLLTINANANNAPTQMDVDNEVTATVQISNRPPNASESTPRSIDSDAFGRMSTTKIRPNNQPETVAHKGDAAQDRRMSEQTTDRIDVALPRLPDVLNLTDDHTTQMILTPAINKIVEKRKRFVTKQPNDPLPVVAPKLELEDEAPRVKSKKPRQRKKKSNDENDQNKDPSAAKVVLQKLNEPTRTNSMSEAPRSERKKSDESVSSTRSSMLSRADQSSDSESSTTSYSSRQISSRPRRQKAPTNLQEPSLSK